MRVKRRKLTNLDVSNTVQQDIVTLDVTVDNLLVMEVGKAFASLRDSQYTRYGEEKYRLASKQIVAI
jgi:hypothetical protein